MDKDQPLLPFHVDAGKYESNDDKEVMRTGEQYSRNYKYCNQFQTLAEALSAAELCRGYAFIDLTYHAPDGKVYDVACVPSAF